ncbi:MAG: hypothetical protein QM775_34235 [Pirellulales bacterium]
MAKVVIYGSRVRIGTVASGMIYSFEPIAAAEISTEGDGRVINISRSEKGIFHVPGDASLVDVKGQKMLVDPSPPEEDSTKKIGHINAQTVVMRSMAKMAGYKPAN